MSELRPTRIERPSGGLFQERLIPAETTPAGWAALGHTLGVQAPVRQPSCVADKHVRGSRRVEAGWRVFDRRYWPGDTFADHLSFALRHEPMDILVAKRVLDAAPKRDLETFIRGAPSGIPGRRAWFYYETLTGKTLDVPDSRILSAVDALDPKLYFTGHPRLSRRHRVRDNLLGDRRFCPILRRTKQLSQFVETDLAQSARSIVGRTGGHLVSRAARFLLLADSRASFEIEGERPPCNRLERWGRAVLQAGKNKLTLDEIVRLHAVLIEDLRFMRAGLRQNGVFLGERDHSGDPFPEFIGARPADLADLMDAMIAANDRMTESGLDPVLQAAATAFGFVYVHPFEDGNGRLHRCLIHHVLAERRFAPPGIVFPVSSVMLDRIEDYRTVLQRHSAPLMPYIEWRPTANHNVEVLNDTADLYRYYDCTEAAEFLYACVRRTIETDLPREIDYLRRHDDALRRIMDAVEMPDRLAENFLMFVRQNGGTLPKRRRENEFRKLADDEVRLLENIMRDAFEGFVE